MLKRLALTAMLLLSMTSARPASAVDPSTCLKGIQAADQQVAPQLGTIPPQPRPMTDAEIEQAFKLKDGGGHAIRHLAEDCDPPLIPRNGPLKSRVEEFKKVVRPMLEHPVIGPVDAMIGKTKCLRYLGKAPDGRWVLISVAAEEPHKGVILSAFVPNATQLKNMGVVSAAAGAAP